MKKPLENCERREGSVEKRRGREGFRTVREIWIRRPKTAREEIKMLDKLNQKTMFGKLNQNKKKII